MDKFVRYDIYCKKCKYKDLKADEDGIMPEPCDECLLNPVNEDSQKPIKFTKED